MKTGFGCEKGIKQVRRRVRGAPKRLTLYITVCFFKMQAPIINILLIRLISEEDADDFDKYFVPRKAF